jgi:hypothetical protein
VAPRSRVRVDIENSVLEFCWGLWSELGVSGWGRAHEKWAIDVEPLVVFTATIGDRDPRLRDEALDWCIRYSRLVSVVRLRNILRGMPDKALSAWGPFAATVNVRAGAEWPGAEDPLSYKITGRSTLRPFTEPSMTYLRIRSIFGVGARAEILRCLLYNVESDRVSVQMLADQTNYGKRIVAEAAESLAQAGILRQRLNSNRNVTSLPIGRVCRDSLVPSPRTRQNGPTCCSWSERCSRSRIDGRSPPQRSSALRFDVHSVELRRLSTNTESPARTNAQEWTRSPSGTVGPAG